MPIEKPKPVETTSSSSLSKDASVTGDGDLRFVPTFAGIGEELDLFTITTETEQASQSKSDRVVIKAAETTKRKNKKQVDPIELTKIHHPTSKRDKVLEGQFELF